MRHLAVALALVFALAGCADDKAAESAPTPTDSADCPAAERKALTELHRAWSVFVKKDEFAAAGLALVLKANTFLADFTVQMVMMEGAGCIEPEDRLDHTYSTYQYFDNPTKQDLIEIDGLSKKEIRDGWAAIELDMTEAGMEPPKR